MESSKKYYKDLNIIRLVACIAVLFYHLGLLKGGYLAVCTFFVLTGYLSVVSSFKKKAFSIKEYYKNRLIKVYIPLVIVVFITIGVTSFFKNVYWISLKNETTSVLLGYNNFWQISANLDYFARHVDSPFMHLWYIGILLQFELIFPFLFKLLKKSGEKIDKIMPCIIPLVFATASIIYFLIASHSSNIMNAYYNTFARCFSIFFGVSLGFIHSYYKPLIPKKIKKGGLSKVLFYIYLGISLILFIFVKSTSNLFTISMILVTLISCRLIDYGTTNKTELNIFDKIVKRVSDISYEIYLIQYPVIYLSQYININHHLKTPLIIIVTIILSYILNMATRKRKKIKVTGIILLIVIIGASTFGGYKYITVKNHQKEMKELEAELAENAKIMEEKQKEYQQIKQQEENDWTKELKKLESEANYEELTKALPVTFIGDSVMLGAMNNLHETFPNSYFDSKESRSTYVGYQIISELKENNKLGDPVVIHLGTNGDCKNGCKEKIMDLLTDRTVFWINTTNMPSVNESLNELSTKYSNLHIIDWYTLSQGQKDWFYSDGIHLPPKGRREYTNIVYNAIYNVYKDNFKTKKDELIKEHK